MNMDFLDNFFTKMDEAFQGLGKGFEEFEKLQEDAFAQIKKVPGTVTVTVTTVVEQNGQILKTVKKQFTEIVK